MTQETENKSIESLCEVLIENGLPGMREALKKLMNLAMQLEGDRNQDQKPSWRSFYSRIRLRVHPHLGNN